ncbi:hypothetical protein ACET3Z_026262 [Daucus carota]
MNAETRSMLSKTRLRKKSTSDDRRHRAWASLLPELLIQILMKLGIVELFACAGVCKEWRSVTKDHRSTLLQNQKPLALVVSKFAKRGCFVHNIFDGTRYKTLLPNFSSRWLMGFSCGYLIMQSHRNITLKHLITRHEIIFPEVPVLKRYISKAILFYSEKVSENLLLVVNKLYCQVYVSLTSRPEWHWIALIGCRKELVDMAYFDGNILVLNKDAGIGELKLQYQTLNADGTTLKARQSVKFFNVRINYPAEWELSPFCLVPTSDQLFMVSHVGQTISPPMMVHRLDRERKEWIQVNDLGEDALFISEGSCAIVKAAKWGGRSNCIYVLSKLSNELSMYLLNTDNRFWHSSVIQEEGSNLRPHFWCFQGLEMGHQGT